MAEKIILTAERATMIKHKMPHPLFKPIIHDISRGDGDKREQFDPEKHISFKPPDQTYSMKDIGYPADTGVSDVAVSQPFELFSKSAIVRMRSEIFAAEVWDKCKFSSNIAACQLRGYSQQYAPFIREAWHHPATLERISKIAGVGLVPAMDFEIGHVNISVKSEEQVREELAIINKQQKLHAEDEGIGGCPWEDDKPVVGWHTDSYPFVCVLMLSDCESMVGGETALRTGGGDVLKVRGPAMGCAVVLQGRYITHQALRALGAQERITMVTSFRPRSPHLPDDTNLATVRPISDLSTLYYEFAEYRLEMLEERLRSKLDEIRKRRRCGKKFETSCFKGFLDIQREFVNHTNKEIVMDEKVTPGYIEEVHFPDDEGIGSGSSRNSSLSK